MDDFDEEKEEEQRYGMPGLTPASEQSFDFDDHAYAAAPGSHGGSVDGEKRVRPSQVCIFCRPFFLYDKTRARGRCISSFWRRRVREGEDRAGDEDDDEEVVRADFARDACRKAPNAIGVSILFFFLYLRFCRAFFCVCARDERLETSKNHRDADAGMRSLFSTARKTGTGRLANTTINRHGKDGIFRYSSEQLSVLHGRGEVGFELVFCSCLGETARSLPSARFRE